MRKLGQSWKVANGIGCTIQCTPEVCQDHYLDIKCKRSSLSPPQSNTQRVCKDELKISQSTLLYLIALNFGRIKVLYLSTSSIAKPNFWSSTILLWLVIGPKVLDLFFELRNPMNFLSSLVVQAIGDKVYSIKLFNPSSLKDCRGRGRSKKESGIRLWRRGEKKSDTMITSRVSSWPLVSNMIHL